MEITGASWFHSDELDIDRTATMVPRRDPIKVTKVFQVKFKIEIQFYYYYYYSLLKQIISEEKTL